MCSTRFLLIFLHHRRISRSSCTSWCSWLNRKVFGILERKIRTNAECLVIINLPKILRKYVRNSIINWTTDNSVYTGLCLSRISVHTGQIYPPKRFPLIFLSINRISLSHRSLCYRTSKIKENFSLYTGQPFFQMAGFANVNSMQGLKKFLLSKKQIQTLFDSTLKLNCMLKLLFI